MSAACPCGGATYESCCEPLHAGKRPAATALELMRSRYAAYARGLADYLVATHAAREPAARRRAQLEASFAGVRWTGLRIVEVREGGAGDAAGIVEFEAAYEAGGKPGVLRERSRFERRAGAWMYLDAVAPEAPRAVGRNDPCPCGSGKKSKKCCGA